MGGATFRRRPMWRALREIVDYRSIVALVLLVVSLTIAGTLGASVVTTQRRIDHLQSQLSAAQRDAGEQAAIATALADQLCRLGVQPVVIPPHLESSCAH